MAMNRNRMALVLASTALLSGCQFFGNLHFGHRGTSDGPAAAMASYYTEQGRTLLRSGRPGEAIEAYNLALATGEAPAPAYNGLGVAYSRLGRPDLSYRFFKKATMSDPANAIYASNLDRLVKSPQFTMDMAPDYQSAPVVAQAAASAAPAAEMAPKSAPSVAVRSRPRQINIVTLAPTDAGAPRAARQGCVKSRAGQRDCDGAGSIEVVTRRRLPTAQPLMADPASDVAAADNAGKPPAGPKRKSIDMRSMPRSGQPGSGIIVTPSTRTS